MPVQYAERNAAWEEFAKRAEIGHYNAALRMQLLAAFNAGWAARKAAQYSAMGAQRKLAANRTQAVDRYLFVADPNKD